MNGRAGTAARLVGPPFLVPLITALLLTPATAASTARPATPSTSSSRSTPAAPASAPTAPIPPAANPAPAPVAGSKAPASAPARVDPAAPPASPAATTPIDPSAPAPAPPSSASPDTDEIFVPPIPVQSTAPAAEDALSPESERGLPRWRQWIDTAGLGGIARFDYYTASKRLDGNRSLPGLTFQPRAMPRFGSWGDAKIEGRLTDQDVSDHREATQARLLEAYTNLYFGSIDVRMGKQIIPWGRADGLNPTDNLTPKDFTVLSARDDIDRRTGTVALRAAYYRGPYTLSLIWLPLFNPNIIPIGTPPGFRVIERRGNSGTSGEQGFAAKLDHTSGDLDWSISYYDGLDLTPVGRPVDPFTTVLIHNRIHVIGADFAKPIGRYGLRGEVAYVHTPNFSGNDPIIKFPYVFAVIGLDREITDDLYVNVQAYHRSMINWQDRFQIEDPVLRNVAVLNVIFNQQMDRYQEGLTGRIRASWLNKTLEAELTGILNLNRMDFFLRPSLMYAFTDVWRGYIGWDIFQGPRQSFFGRLEPMTAFFVEIRAVF